MASPVCAFTLPLIAKIFWPFRSRSALNKTRKLRVNSAKVPDLVHSPARPANLVYGYKTLVEEDSGRILGAHIVGAECRRSDRTAFQPRHSSQSHRRRSQNPRCLPIRPEPPMLATCFPKTDGVLQSGIACSALRHRKNRRPCRPMPVRFFYMCTGCGAMLRPKPGDCCVFCSYGSVPCPPIQAERSGGDGRRFLL